MRGLHEEACSGGRKARAGPKGKWQEEVAGRREGVLGANPGTPEGAGKEVEPCASWGAGGGESEVGGGMIGRGLGAVSGHAGGGRDGRRKDQ